MGFQVVGESGLFNPDDVAYVQNAGVSAVSFQITCGLM
jgi:indole-3-glycerol phosphate synthase